MMPLFKCCLSFEEQESIRINAEIERRLKLDKRDSMRCYKLLLLGTGEAGKSTFIKQMRIIHGTGFDERDRMAFIKYVHQNVNQSMKAMLEAMHYLQIPLKGNKRLSERFTLMNSRASHNITPEQFNVIRSLWKDKGVQEAFKRRNEYQLSDSTSYFMDRLDVIARPNYIPSIQDVLHVRIRTTAIVQHTFQVKNINFQMIDVSGQRSERRKWFHCFDNVTSVIFLVSLSEYDQVLFEDSSINRLEESLSLYRTILRCPWFSEASIMLFLNKLDLLQEKIMYSHLDDYFPTFTGPRKNVFAAQKFILSLFADENTEAFMTCYSHFTCATDTKNIEVVFATVQDTILKKTLSDFHLV